MYNHNKAQQSKNPVHISWDILYWCASILWRALLFCDNLQILLRSLLLGRALLIGTLRYLSFATLGTQLNKFDYISPFSILEIYMKFASANWRPVYSELNLSFNFRCLAYAFYVHVLQVYNDCSESITIQNHVNSGYFTLTAIDLKP